ncbi:MAG: T9SS type A sorting domain-containing protein [Ignavibacteriales bacterium]|nr:T9SS type A sorting domain-containing protein [Ignavibacteriales bacterium]
MKNILIVCLLFVFAGISFGQMTVHSNGSGGGSWKSTTTWLGGVLPTGYDSVVIASGDSVYFSSATPDSCKSLTILSSGKMAVISIYDTLLVTDKLTLMSGSIYYNGSYSGSLPGATRSIDNNSTVVFRSSTVGGPNCNEFGHIVIERSAGSNTGADLIIHGNLIINNATNGTTFRGIYRDTKGFRNHTIYGNVYLYRGQWSCVDYGSDSTIGCAWNVEGNVNVIPVAVGDARIGPLTSASAVGIGIFNIKGNLNIVGGRFQCGSSSTLATGTGIFNLGGDFTITGGGWTTTNTKGDFAVNFVGTSPQTVKLDTNFSINTRVYDTVATGSKVIFDLGKYAWRSYDSANGTTGGAFVVNGTLELKDSTRLRGMNSFTLNPGATLIIGKNDGIMNLPDSTNGNIQVSGTRTYSTGANYEYKGYGYQETGDGLPSSVNNLTINNSNDVKLLVPVTVNGTVAVNSGDFKLNGNKLTLGPTATMVETPGNTCVGTVEATRTLSQNVAESFGGIGATINAAGAAPGVTTIQRVTDAGQSGNGFTSILRSFDIVPTTNSGLNATVDFYYDASELNGQNSANLKLWKSADAGSTWSYQTSSNYPLEYHLQKTGVDEMSRWSLSDQDNPLNGQFITIASGWNLLSIPVIAPDFRTVVLFPSAASKAFAYTNSYEIRDTLKTGPGYWVKFSTYDLVHLMGPIAVTETIQVNAGWNMIGSIGKLVAVSNIGLSSGLTIGTVYKYTGSYQMVTTITPGFGYWVKANISGTLTLTSTANVVGKTENSTHEMLNNLNSITIKDKKGIEQTLYFGSSRGQQIDPTIFELPPVGPEGMFDVRFSTQRYVEIMPNEIEKSIQYKLSLHGVEYPIVVKWNIVEGANYAYILNSDAGIKQIFSGKGEITITNPVKSLNIEVNKGETLPAEFSLGKSYPNPFNPSTKFVISVPQNTQLEVAIYDILGRKIRTLLSGEKTAGYHTIEWNGLTDENTTATSGVYFIRMISEKFNATQKIVMMK